MLFSMCRCAFRHERCIFSSDVIFLDFCAANYPVVFPYLISMAFVLAHIGLPVIFIAGRPKAALLFWFFGDFRCGALLFMVIHVIYKYNYR